jgi:hypothetical protein
MSSWNTCGDVLTATACDADVCACVSASARSVVVDMSELDPILLYVCLQELQVLVGNLPNPTAYLCLVPLQFVMCSFGLLFVRFPFSPPPRFFVRIPFPFLVWQESATLDAVASRVISLLKKTPDASGACTPGGALPCRP